MMDFDVRAAPTEEPDEAGPVDDRPAVNTALMPWLKLRHALGATRDRRKWLQFMCAATSYDPLEWQKRFHLADSGSPDIRVKLATCGVGAGKTTCSTIESAGIHLVNPGCDHVMVAPTYDQCREILLPRWLERMEELAENGYPLLRNRTGRFSGSTRIAVQVSFRSAEKVANLRGHLLAVG
ncbi:MAG: hypothetical protein U1F43_26280 [Myxococcota bacterium]